VTTTNSWAATDANAKDACRVTLASEADRQRIITTVASAFTADPVARGVFSGEQYARHFPAFASIFGGGAIGHESAFMTADGRAAALWYPPGTGPDEPALMGILEQSLSREAMGKMMGLFEEMDRHHPAGPHWYLPMIAVDPACQRRGYGSALLRHVLERLDREGQVAYLESSNPANHELYRRHGFEARGTIKVGRIPPLLAMVREPR
jgi:ribosomal protein S18 acetylase RimI-like enzyme